MDNNFFKGVDPDLNFLYNCSNEDLVLLCDIITKDKDGKPRISDELTKKDKYKRNYPHNMRYLIPEISAELQKYGGNTFANVVRQHGVPYREILIDVCKSQKVNFNKSASTSILETYLLQKILITSIEHMNDEDIHHYMNNASKKDLIKQVGVIKAGSPLFLKGAMIAVQQLAEKQGLKLVGQFAARFIGSKAYSMLAGPVGWAISILWSAIDLAGAAYRVTFPATITVAYLRTKSQFSDEELSKFI